MTRKVAKISIAGPLTKIEGGWMFMHPSNAYPLEGYENFSFEKSEKILTKLSEYANAWWDNFPNCCDYHKQFNGKSIDAKTKFKNTPDRITNNFKYFAYALHLYAYQDLKLDVLLDYLFFLRESFGRPYIGLQVFDKFAKYFTEKVKIPNKYLSDDQRIEILSFFEPQNKNESSDTDDLLVLQETFEMWVAKLPSIGNLVNLKNQLEGKSPLFLFFKEVKYNQFLGTSISRAKTSEELLTGLEVITKNLLKQIQDELLAKDFSKDEYLKIAEEKLRIKQDELLSEDLLKSSSTYELIVEWLNNFIGYYNVVSQVVAREQNDEIIEAVNDVKASLKNIDIVGALNDWLCDSKNKLEMKELNRNIKLSDENSEGMIRLLEDIREEISLSKNQTINKRQFEVEVGHPTTSLKHKLKIAIPVFLFTKYEAELELSQGFKFPKNLLELRKLLKK